MKKVISIVLCLSLIISCGVFAFGAQSDKSPIILVPGFLESKLCVNVDKWNEETLFPPTPTAIVGQIVKDSPNFVLSLIGFLFGDYEGLGERLGYGANMVCEKMKCNPDGTSIYNTSSYFESAEKSTYSYLRAHKLGSYLVMNALAGDLADEVGGDRVFIFNYDCRFDSITLGEQLHEFIQDVKQYTGSDTVRLVSHSYGGGVLSAYFYYHRFDGDVTKATMIYPALGGTDAVDYIMRCNSAEIPLNELIRFLESYIGNENEIAKILDNADFEMLNRIAHGALVGNSEVVKYWGAVYSLANMEDYPALRDDFLDPVESAPIIRNNDIIHYQIMPNLHSILSSCRANGIDVSVICGSGSPMAMGGNEDADILLPVYATSGAKCALLGESFEDGYRACGTHCGNKNHNHVSPAMDIDASAAYLPENTWFIEKTYHGSYNCENYTFSLVKKLILTDELKDVHSDPAYPQFEYSDNANRGIHISCDSSSTGYISETDSALVIKNCNKLTPVKLTSIEASGLNLEFDSLLSTVILPGQSVTIPFRGTIPAVKGQKTTITADYVEVGILDSFCKAERVFTVNSSACVDVKGSEHALSHIFPDMFQ